MTLATSYAVGDYFGLRHSLHRRWRDARTFHRTYAACVLAAAAVVLIPQVPLGLLTTAVQALAGILLPSATVFLLLLCNDREVLGPLVNSRWLNVLAAAVTGSLLAPVRAAHRHHHRPAPASGTRRHRLAHARPDRPALLRTRRDHRPGRSGYPARTGRGWITTIRSDERSMPNAPWLLLMRYSRAFAVKCVGMRLFIAWPQRFP